MKKAMRLGFFVFIAALVLTSCPLWPPQGEIALTLRVADSIAEKTILPDRPMEAVLFTISAVGPTPVQAFDTSESTITLGHLLPGSYTVTVVGKNAEGDEIGGASGSCTVGVGNATQLMLVVTEFGGTGTLEGQITWEAYMVASPAVEGTMKGFDGTVTALSYKVDPAACIGEQASQGLAVGWYTLVVQLFDRSPEDLQARGTLVAGTAEAVRIAQGATSAYEYFFPAATGTIDIGIGVDFMDPLELEVDPNPEPFGLAPGDEPTTLSLTDSGTQQAITTLWYRNGDLIAGSLDATELTIDPSDLEGGTYVYSLVVFTTDGRHAGSANWRVTVTGAREGMVFFDLELGALIQAGYEVTQVQYLLAHQGTGETVQGDLTLEDQSAIGEVANLAAGDWDVQVTALEYGSLLSKATTTVTVVPGVPIELYWNPSVGDEVIDHTIGTRPRLGPLPVAMPDLRPRNLVAPWSAEPGEAIGSRLQLEVQNRGGAANAADGSVTVAVYMSPLWFLTSSARLLTNGRVQLPTPIPAGQTVSLSVPASVAIPPRASAGSYYLVAVVDEQREVREGSESNNVVARSISVETATGLWVSSRWEVVAGIMNTLDLQFTSDEAMSLVRATWDFRDSAVWLDVTESTLLESQNVGAVDFDFFWGDPPSTVEPSENLQVFGLTASYFDSGDYISIGAGLDRGPLGSGTPYFDDMKAGTLTVEFSNGLVVVLKYDTPEHPDWPYGGFGGWATLGSSP